MNGSNFAAGKLTEGFYPAPCWCELDQSAIYAETQRYQRQCFKKISKRRVMAVWQHPPLSVWTNHIAWEIITLLYKFWFLMWTILQMRPSHGHLLCKYFCLHIDHHWLSEQVNYIYLILYATICAPVKYVTLCVLGISRDLHSDILQYLIWNELTIWNHKASPPIYSSIQVHVNIGSNVVFSPLLDEHSPVSFLNKQDWDVFCYSFE